MFTIIQLIFLTIDYTSIMCEDSDTLVMSWNLFPFLIIGIEEEISGFLYKPILNPCSTLGHDGTGLE